ncbi:MAG: hypothetical protein ACK52J_04275 [bacterium]|jgi:hypothetical protein
MGLRHSTKSKYVKNLLRFAGGGDKKEVQNSIADISKIHQNLVKKMKEMEKGSDVS